MVRLSFSRLIPICLAFGLGFPAIIAPAQALERETIPVNVDGTTINVYLYLPEGKGPFPLLIMSHGSPRNGAGRERVGANTLSSQAETYAQSGVAVAVPVRRGYGGIGQWEEDYGSCEAPDYYRAGRATARDIRAALNMVKTHAGIDRARIALIGISAGGFGSVAAGSEGGVKAVINFAGGRGSRGPDDVCKEDLLVSAMARFGRGAKVPELWVYSSNDHFFGPALAQRMFKAFNGAGGRASFIEAPAYGFDGHGYFSDIAAWKPTVDNFLRQVGFLR